MSRSQDTVIDDDEDTCPLCIEEFDLSDKNFRPCPCGYQICQFCFNSLKTTYEKSNCPNCRRPYDEKTIQYKIPSAEEFKLDQLNKNKKQQAARRREVEKREVDNSTRRNLAGVRVKQQNLVYVIGLIPTIKDESLLLQTLRGTDYFGQYGEIEKIVVSKAKPGAINQGIGVYVTYKRKEDAAVCINTVDGSLNGERVLRAQFGTTKYCSAFLRGETCNNKSCSFLHETGEDGQSTSLQNEPFEKSKPPSALQQIASPARTQTTPQPPAASQAMARQDSKDATSRRDSHDSSALPSTASWANPAVKVRQMSQAGSRATPSPELTQAQLAPQKSEPSKPKNSEPSQPVSKSGTTTASTRSASPVAPLDSRQALLDKIIRDVTFPNLKFCFDDSILKPEDREYVNSLPRLIDPFGGVKRRMMQDREATERARSEAEVKSKLEAQAQALAEDVVDEDNMANGSLALGGEPDDNPGASSARGGAIGRPQGSTSNQFSNLGLDTQSQALQQRQPPSVPQAPGLPQPPSQNAAFEMSDFERRAPQFSQAQYDQISNHQRNGSRYFNSDSKTTSSRFSGQQQSFYSSGVHGPPPGLQTAGTPSVSGGGMFAHGQNFTNPGFGAAKDPNTDMHMRGRSATGGGPEINKRGGVEHLADPSIVQARVHQSGAAGQGPFGVNQVDESHFPPLPGKLNASFPTFHSRVSSLQSLQSGSLRPTTPKIPPGFEATHSHPPIGSRPVTPAPTQQPIPQRAVSSTVIPLVPALPISQRRPTSKPSTPKPKEEKKDVSLSKDAKPSVGADTSRPSTPKRDRPGEISLGSPKPTSRTKSEVKSEPEVKVEPSTSESQGHTSVIIPPPPVQAPKQPSTSPPTNTGKAGKENVRPQKIDLPLPIAILATTEDVPEHKDTPVLGSATVATPPPMSSVPSTPATTSTEFSKPVLSRPRTLRVTTGMIQKAEPAPPSATTDRSVTLPLAAQLQQRSRQPSIASFAQSRPSTPSTQDVSRASSPHPSVVGSAPERAKTRAQLKKERKESRRKADPVETGTAEPALAAVEEVGPIVARQKKQKKRADNNLTEDSPRDTPATPKEEKAVEKPPTPIKPEPEPTPPVQSEKTRSKKQTKRETRIASPAPVEPQEERPVTPEAPQPPYTLRDYYNDVSKFPALSQQDSLKLLAQHTSPMNSILSSLLSSGDIEKTTHPWFNQTSFNSSAFKIPPDHRKGQDYLDAHGYVDDAFGYVYLPQREKRALAVGNAVSVADTGVRATNLLRRALITPSGWVLRHLSEMESERVLELEERSGIFQEDFGELGIMPGLGALKADDYTNLAGGLEELSRNGDRHGVCWVVGDDENQMMAQYEDVDDYDDLEGDESEGTDDLQDETVGRASWNGREGGVQKRENTLPPLQGRNVNLRGMANEQLQRRVMETQKEMEQARRDVERLDKLWQKKGKEVERWRKGIAT